MTIQEIDNLISEHQIALNELRIQRQKLIDEQDALKVELEQAEYMASAYKNENDALFDGLKYITDFENPIPLHLPMLIRPNMYYKYNDGIKDITYIYIKSSEVVVATEENYLEYLTPYIPE